MSLLHGNRSPVVAGSFYPDEKDRLFEEIHRCFTNALGPGTFLPTSEQEAKQERAPTCAGCFVVPHAGYIYSGPIAAHSYLVVANFIQKIHGDEFLAIILGPNHYGIGSGIAISSNSVWETPFGEVAISEEYSRKLLDSSDFIDIDELSHSREHSIEVQLPFLQTIATRYKKRFKFVPICLMLQDRESAERVSKTILSVFKKKEGMPLVILGSSDLTHYEPQRVAKTKDKKLLTTVEKLDLLGFYTTLERENVTACGYGAIASVMGVAKGLGLTKGNVLKYATSGDVTGDRSSVVGYSAVEFG